MRQTDKLANKFKRLQLGEAPRALRLGNITGDASAYGNVKLHKASSDGCR